MVMESQNTTLPGVYTAPISVQQNHIAGSSNTTEHKRNASSHGSNTHSSTGSRSQMTPPATPNGSQENLHQQLEPAQPFFHNFLRAFYPFQPPYEISDSTVTLPLAEGDVILVHSIHTNGWADGTLLATGARGWLPTNYCEAYEPDSMRNLLRRS